MDTEYDGYVSDRHAEVDGFQDTNLDEPHDADLNIDFDPTETELSQDIFYESIKNLVHRSQQRRERRQTARKQKRKRSKPSGDIQIDRQSKAYSRCSLPYLYAIIQKVLNSNHYTDLVKQIGFGYILELDDCYIPRHFVQWIADHVITQEEQIKIGAKTIPLNRQSLEETIGIRGGEEQVLIDEESGKAMFLSLFGLQDVPPIRFFGDKILKSETLEDDEFCRCFAAVALGCFLCPNSNTKLSTKYMGALVVVEKIKYLDWPKFVNDWLIWYIKKYQAEKNKGKRLTSTLGGCIYHLAVRCLDFIDFGLIILPSTLPRIKVWKGNMIKCFSDMIMDKNGKYGAPILKDIEDTCYRKGESYHLTISKELFCSYHGHNLTLEAENSIASAFLKHMENQDRNLCLKAKALVNDVIQAIGTTNNSSEDTLKIQSSQEVDDCNQSGNNSGSTEKIPSDEDEYIEDEEQNLVPRKRRRQDLNNMINSTSQLNDSNEKPTDSHMHLDNQQNETMRFDPEDKVKDIEHIVNKTASLDYLIPEDDSDEIKSANKNSASSAIDELNLGSFQEHGESATPFFSGFGNKESGQPILKRLQDEVVDINLKRDIDMNLPNIAIIAEHYAKLKLNSEKPKKRSQVIEEARKNYFFYDDGTPSFRLSQSDDDHGKHIEEPELWRPLGMESDEYNMRIEEAKLRADNMENSDIIESNSPETPKEKVTRIVFDSQKSNGSSYLSSVQCAQRQQTCTDLTDSPVLLKHNNKPVVDLVTPEVSKKLYSMTERSYEARYSESRSSETKPDYSKVLIVGRKLFQSGNDDDDIQYIGTTHTNLHASTGVRVLGENFSNHYSNFMCNKADDLYNTDLSLASASSSASKENFIPRRALNASKYICSPYDSILDSVKPIELKHYEAITTLCDIEEYKNKYAVKFDNCKVSVFQLGSSLKEKGKVMSYVINVFCRKLFKDKHPKISNNHYFFSTSSDYFLEKWPNEETRQIWRSNTITGLQLASGARALHLSNRLHFPSVFHDHWLLFIVDLKGRNFLFLDSYYGKEDNFSQTTSNLLIKNFKKTWSEAGLKKIQFENYGVVYPNVPKQNNDVDCGVFLLTQMQRYCPRDPSACVFSWKDIPKIRIKLANELQFCKWNEEEESMWRVQNFDAKMYRRN